MNSKGKCPTYYLNYLVSSGKILFSQEVYMRKVVLSMNEQLKYEVIKELVDHNGNKHRAALKLNLSIRQINRLIVVYKSKGKAGFMHANRNRQPSNSLSPELVNRIITLYRNDYQGFNFKHFTEKLNEIEDIHISYKTVYNILTKNGIYPPKEHRATKRKRAKANVLANKPNIKEEDLKIAISHEISIEDSHPRKPRAKYFGEEIQMDGSIHYWFGNSKATLHLAIDNATGTIVGGYFDSQETLNGYYQVFKQILEEYGIPAKFLTDNRTVFYYKSLKRKAEEKDVLTQFGYACKILGIDLETSSVSQYKGQIERANGTFQDRLVSELRHENIVTIEEANAYLINTFIPDFNRRFAFDYKQFDSVMDEKPSADRINRTLAICAPRKFDNGSAISYKNQYYEAYDENGKLICFKPHTECLVIVSFDKTMYVTVDDKVYLLLPIEKNKHVSEMFDRAESKSQEPKKYIPPMTHPWKRASFIKQREQAHRYQIYA